MAYSVTGAAWRSQFAGKKFAPMLQLQSSGRKMGETLDAIKAEREAHKDLIDGFHRMWYASRQTHGMTFFENIPILKNPLDLWIYQEIVWDLKPTLIIETGTAYGGSALYFARQLDRVFETDPDKRQGHVISIDLEPAEHLPTHPRISYVRGYSSVLPELVEKVGAIAAQHERVMVCLDSDHSKRHVAAELEAYAPMVSYAQFLVVEDTNINGRPVEVEWRGGPGPGPAVDEWLPAHPEFEQSTLAERYHMTFDTWLRKVK